MNLERCIEQDMLLFLDGAMKPADASSPVRKEDAAYVYANKDWEQSIKDLLKRGSIAEAKQLFGQLKEHYNQVPEEHHEERKRLYAVIQGCYVLIVNAIQEKERTAEMLKTMEQHSADVFDSSVRPINLQVVERSGAPKQTGEQPITRQMVEQQFSSGALPSFQGNPVQPIIVMQMPQASPIAPAYASQSNASNPLVTAARPTPSLQAPQPLPAPSLASSSSVASSSSSPPTAQSPAFAPIVMPVAMQPQDASHEREHREHVVVSAVRSTVKRCAELAKVDPAQALAELKELGDTIMSEEQQLHVSRIVAKQLLGQVEELQRSIRSAGDAQSFARSFNSAFAQLSNLARTKDTRAIDVFARLSEQAQAYAKTNPQVAAQYIRRLMDVRDSFGLYSEDEVVAKVTPLITRLRIAQRTGSSLSYEQALAELDRFTKMLPHTPSRSMLEDTLVVLRRKRPSAMRQESQDFAQEGEQTQQIERLEQTSMNRG